MKFCVLFCIILVSCIGCAAEQIPVVEIPPAASLRVWVVPHSEPVRAKLGKSSRAIEDEYPTFDSALCKRLREDLTAHVYATDERLRECFSELVFSP